MEVIKKGSVESLIVALRDRLGNVSDLNDVTSLLFDTKKKENNAACETNKVIVIDPEYPMSAVCSIDTTLVAYEAGKEYKLYIKYTAGSEAPVIGPRFFRVEDD